MNTLIKRLFIIFAAAVIPLLLLSSNAPFSESLVSTSDEFFLEFNDRWGYRWDDSGAADSAVLPGMIKGGAPGRVLWLVNVLPQKRFDSATLLIRSSQQYINVYVDRNLIYSNNDSTNYMLPGSSWHFIRLPDTYEGKSIEISLVSPYKQYSGLVNSVFIGSESSLVLDLVYRYGMILIISCIILLFGIILIILYYILKSEEGRFKSLLYLGQFSLLSGSWIASESKIIQFIINNPVLVFYIACVSLFLIPIPLLLFVITTYKPKKSKYLTGLVWASAIFFTLISVIQIFNKAAYFKSMLAFHLLLLACIVTVIVISVSEMKTGNKDIRILSIGFFILCIFSIKDMYGFYFSSIPGLNAQVSLQFAVLVFILLLAASMGHYILQILNLQTINKVYEALAYTDVLTGLKNRNSFEEMTLSINKTMEASENVSVIVFDMNNLKTVNDTLGHLAGDRLLYKASALINECFGKIGEVYRIGGDEFAVVITEFPEAAAEKELLNFENRVKEYNRQEGNVEIGIAYGMSSFRKGEDKDFYSVLERADVEMYNCKRQQKCFLA